MFHYKSFDISRQGHLHLHTNSHTDTRVSPDEMRAIDMKNNIALWDALKVSQNKTHSTNT